MLSRRPIVRQTSSTTVVQTWNARKRAHLLRRVGVSGLTLFALAGSAVGAPEGAQVVTGRVTFEQAGLHTTITASHNSIINYTGFNLNRSESVQFVQPSASSRVLNRISGDAPTTIDGRITANGQVFFVNRAGVFFGPNSVIDVGQIFAAGASLSNRDFLAGNLNFTDMRGMVVNEGTIRADTVALVGRAVANRGTIEGLDGAVVMAAGDQLYLREGPRGTITVQIAQPTGGPTPNSVHAVQNSGTINAGNGSVSMAAGDMYSLAIKNTGRINAAMISLNGGANGRVDVGGTLDASRTQPGSVGGQVDITGHTVVLDGATVRADGPAGGGEIRIGGGFAGLESDIRNSSIAVVSRDSTISASATSAGSGGRVVVWSNDWTWFGGSLLATGAGNGAGGFAEVSSADKLGFHSMNIDLRGGAPKIYGTLLLDPGTLTISDIPATTGTLDPNLPNILAGTGGAVETVSYASVNVSLAAASLILEAANSIVFDTIGGGGFFSFSNLVGPNTLTLRTTAAGGAISFTTLTNTISSGVGGNFVFTTGTGGLSLGNVSTSGAGTISLTATGGASGIAGATLATGAFTSTGVNFTGAVTTTTGAININHSGAVVANGTGLRTTGGNISVTGSTYNQSAGSLRTAATFPGVTGTITLNMTGGVTNGLEIITDVLRISAVDGINLAGVSANFAALLNATTGNIVLNGPNTLGTIAGANTAAAGTFEVLSTGAPLTIGTIPLLVGFNAGVAVAGITTSNGALTLVNTGGISITTPVNIGTGIARLSATNGVAQSATGTITADSLAVRNATAGNIDLSLAGNAVSNVALTNTFATGTIGFNSGQSLVVTSVPAAALTVPFAGATAGITTAGNGSILLTVGGSGQTLTLNQPVNNGANALSILRIGASGTISQDAVGLITTGTLGVVSIGAASNNILLTEGNTFSTLAGRIVANARQFRVRSVVPVTVGSVPLLAGFNAGAALTGVQIGAGGDVLVSSGGAATALTVNEQINAPGGTVRLVSTSGIGQGVNGLITASSLGLTNTVGDVLLDVAGVSVSGLAARNTAANAEIIVLDTDGLSITDVTGIALLFNAGATLSGVNTTDGNITLITNDSAPGTGAAILTLDANVAAGTGTIRLGAEGSIQQNAGAITGASLGLFNNAFGDIIATSATNNFANVSALNTVTGGGFITLRTSAGLTVDSLNNAAYAIFNGGAIINGILGTAPQTITLVSGASGALTLNQPVNAGATGTARLSSDGGITQAAAGVITAQNLGIVNATAGSVDLTTATNAVGTFAARNDFATGTIELGSDSGLILGTIAAGPVIFNAGNALVGLTTTGGGSAFLLNTSTTLPVSLTTATSLPAGGILRVQSAGGIGQIAAGGVVATSIAAVNTTAGNVDLTLGTNTITTLAASNTFATGTIAYTDSNGLVVGTVAAGPALFNAGAALSGVVTNAGDAIITSGTGGPLAINQPLNVGAANVARLSSRGGITQSGPGVITAGGLAVLNDTAGDIGLETLVNVLSNIAARNDFASGQATFRSNNGLSVDTIAAGPATFNGGVALTGINTIDGDALLINSSITNPVALNQASALGNGIFRIASSSGVTQTATGGITASGLGITNTTDGNINLTLGTNTLTTFAARNTFATGSIALSEADGLVIGRIDGNPASFNAGTDLNGVTTATGDALVITGAGGALTINQPVNVGAANAVRLSSQGGITQNAIGILTAQTLGVLNATAGNIILDQANAVSTFSGSNTFATGTIQLRSSLATSVGTLATNPANFNAGADLNGVSTASGDLAIRSDDTLTLTQAVNAPAFTVQLSSNGAMTQTGAGVITANALGAVNVSGAAGDITLDLPNLLTAAGATPASFAAFNANTNASGITFRNVGAYDIGTVTALNGFLGTPPGPFTSIIGVNTLAANGDITLFSTTGGLFLTQQLNAGTGIVRMASGGVNSGGVNAIGQNATGVITASRLALVNSSGSPILLNTAGANLVDRISAVAGTGALTFRGSREGTLEVFDVAALAGFNGGVALTGITGSGNINVLTETGAARPITVTSPIVGGAGNVLIETESTADASPILVNGRVSTTSGNITFRTNNVGSTITVSADPTLADGSDAPIFSTSGNVLLRTLGGANMTLTDTADATEGFVIFTGGSSSLVATGATGTINIAGDLSATLGHTFSGGTGTTITLTGTGDRDIVANGGLTTFTRPVDLNVTSTTVDGGAGRVMFQGAITGTGANRDLNVFSTFNTVANANAASVLAPIIFGGDIGTVGNRLGVLTLGGNAAGARVTGPEYSSIVFSSFQNADGTVPGTAIPGATTFSVFTNTLTARQFEKILSLGNLTLNTTGITTVGDLSIIGALNITTATLRILERGPGNFRSPLGLVATDGGVDIIANTINSNAAVNINTVANQGVFALAPSSFYLGRVATTTLNANFAGAQSVKQLTSAPSLAQTLNGGIAVPIDFEASGRTPNDPSTAIAGVAAEDAVQRTDPAQVVGGATRKFLDELKISVRDVGADDLVNFLNGLSYIDDSGSLMGGSMASRGSGITARRINPVAAEALRLEWIRLAIDPVPVLNAEGQPEIGADGQPVTQQRQERLRAVLEAAFVDFTEQAGSTEVSPAIFESFLASTPRHAEALKALQDIRAFMVKLGDLGLTRYELSGPREELLRIFRPDSIPFEYFSELVTKRPLQTAAK